MINFPSNWNTQSTIIKPTIITPTIITQSATMPLTLGEAFKPKRAGKDTSHVIFVLDDSGSMQSCRDATISGYNEYLQLQKEDAKKTGIQTFVSLFKFDGSAVTCVFDRISVDEVKDLDKQNYDPQGMTNLYDAIGGVMIKINAQLSEKKKADRDSIIITILTDGGENSSRTFDNINIKQMVEKAEGKNWGFMFLGANINAFDTGSKLGFSSQNTMQYSTATAATLESTMRSASAMTNRLKSAYSAGISTNDAYGITTFTDVERARSIVEHDE